MMAFRAMSHWRRAATTLSSRTRTGAGNNHRSLATSATVDEHLDQQQQIAKPKPTVFKGNYVPVCVALGMITLSLSFGVHTALNQLRYSPTVHVSKKKREELPEVEEPEYVVEEADKFIKKSFFRKVAHIQDHERHQAMPNPIRGNIYTRPVKVETLKTIGVESGKQ